MATGRSSNASGEMDPRRRGPRAFASRHPRLVWIGAAVAIGLVAFVLLWFQPQKLVIDRTVDEAIPGTGAGEADGAEAESGGGGAGTGASAPAARAEPRRVAAGEFRGLEHDTTGRALILESASGRTFLRLQDLHTSNGPDLRVYLSEIPASDDWYAYGERFVDLGALKGNIGDQNYALPADVATSRYKSAVIWCRRFTVGFGVAPLQRL